MKHKFQWILLPSGILLLIAGLWIMLTYLWAGVVFLALSAIAIGVSAWYLTRCKRDIRDEMDDIFNSNGIAAVSNDLRAEFFYHGIDVYHDDLCAFLTKQLGRLMTNTACCTGNNRNFIF